MRFYLKSFFFFSALVASALVACSVTQILAIEPIRPAPDATKPFSPEESAKKFRVPNGFRVDLVASEPLLADPTCITFDEHGRLFVGELHGYNLEGYLDVTELNKTGKLDREVRRIHVRGPLHQEARKRTYGTVKLLKDNDGDGRMDKAVVFADHLPPCYGLTAARGGIIAVCPPEIIYLADRDGDGVAEVRETLFRGFTQVELERGINNPRPGLDNWIYVGAGGERGTITGPHLRQPVEIGHTNFRIRADGTAIEPVTGSVGTFGMAFSDFGDCFPGSGGGPVFAIPLDQQSLSRNPFVAAPQSTIWIADYSTTFPISQPDPWRVKRGQDPAWVKFYGPRETSSNYFTAGCGNVLYRAGLFPSEYQGQFFCCEPSQNIVHRAVLSRDGAGFRARRAVDDEKSEFLASTDQWFRPNNLEVGPDGALYIVDMYREIIEDYSAIPRFLQQQYGLVNGDDRGRIWRLSPIDGPVRQRLDLAALSDDELVRYTGDRDAWWRATAQRLLVERGNRAVAPALSRQVRQGKTPQARLHALYTLDGLGALTPAEVAHALRDEHYGVRVHALRLSERWLADNSELAAQAVTLADDSDASVRLQVALSLGAAPTDKAQQPLLRLATTHGQEPWMAAAILSSARHSAPAILAGLLRLPEIPDGGKKLLQPLATTIGAQGTSGQIAELLAAVDRHGPTVQLACLEGWAKGLSQRKDRLAMTTMPAPLGRWTASASGEIKTAAVRLAVALQLGATAEVRGAFAEAARGAQDEKLPLAQRKQALRLLACAPFPILQPVVTELLTARHAPDLQVAAVGTLSECDDPGVAAVLLGDWNTVSPSVRTAIIKGLLAREDRLVALLDAVESKRIHPSGIGSFQQQYLTTHRDAKIANRASKLLQQQATTKETAQRLAQFQQALGGPRDVQAGKAVFAKHCQTCHRVSGEGFEVGPNLGSAMNKPDESILMSILDPSSQITSGFESYIVVRLDGRISGGILASESPTSVTLRRDKGETEMILRSEIDTLSASQISIMPDNLYQQMTPKDAADLIAYLRAALAQPQETAAIAPGK